MKYKKEIAILMSTEVGLRTQYLNWRDNFTDNSEIEPVWIPVNWWKNNGDIEKIPLLPSGIKARMRAYLEIKEGFKNKPYDALLLASSVTLPGGNRLLNKQPFFIMLDITPKQMTDFGEVYGKHKPKIPYLQIKKHEMWRWRFQNAKAIFPWSQWAADSMIRDYDADPKKIYVVPPGINLDEWKYVERGDREEPVHILFVGGNFKRKGGELLLDWVKTTKRDGWILDMVTRDLVTPPNEKVRIYNNLEQTNPKLKQLYEEADIFALPTLGDCYSLASLEAMATGLPVIVSSIGGIPEIIRDGITGWLIPSGDQHALSDLLDDMIEHQEKRIRMGAQARRDVEEKWDAKRNINKILQSILSNLEHVE